MGRCVCRAAGARQLAWLHGQHNERRCTCSNPRWLWRPIFKCWLSAGVLLCCAYHVLSRGRKIPASLCLVTRPGAECQSQFRPLVELLWVLCHYRLPQGLRKVAVPKLKPHAWQGQEMMRGHRQSRLQKLSGADLFWIHAQELTAGTSNFLSFSAYLQWPVRSPIGAIQSPPASGGASRSHQQHQQQMLSTCKGKPERIASYTVFALSIPRDRNMPCHMRLVVRRCDLPLAS
ncbi:hypothetical protein B0I37DRAFT_138557 [Chaetomium sp. MPI-CAGE-AT-0009]|nr:hypothetical protein B0I37DRAFT_138557 [Chaetomium sp. MPI-CAGE-AT-0009]